MMYGELKTLGRKLIGLALFAAMSGGALLLLATGPSAEPTQRAERAWPVSFSVVQPATLNPVLLAYGRMEAGQTATLRTRASGTVARVLRSEGDWVEAGELLVQLDALDAELALAAARSARAQAQAALSSAESDYRLAQQLVEHQETQDAIARSRLERFEHLHARRMISDADLDEMRHRAAEQAMVLARHLASVEDFPNQIALRRAALDEAEARVRLAQQDLAHTTLQAPFSGRVLSSEVAAGDRLPAGAQLMQVADYQQLQLRVSLPATLAETLRPSLSAQERIRAHAEMGGRQVAFELQRLAADVKPGQSGVDAFFSAEPDPDLLIGSLANLQIQLPPQPQVIAVPVHALYEGDQIYLIEENRLRAVAVQRVGDHVTEDGNYRVLVRSPEIQGGARMMTSQLPVAMTGLLVSPVDGGDAPPMQLAALR